MRAIGKGERPADERKIHSHPLIHKQRENLMNKTFLATLSLAVLTSGTFALADQRGEQQALAQSKISAAQAVAIAEKASGARVEDLELDMKDGRAVFDLDLRSAQAEFDIHVDAASGDIIKQKSEADDDTPRNAAISMSQAIETAEKESGAKVVDAELEGHQAGVVYQIELLGNDGSRHYIAVDAADGKILSKR